MCAERAIAAEEFVAAQAGERNFQSRLARRPGNEIGVDAVHAGLIEGRNGFVEPREHFVAGKRAIRNARCRALRPCGGRFPLR